jgi:hypothetical protein
VPRPHRTLGRLARGRLASFGETEARGRASPRGANRTLGDETWFGFVRGTGQAVKLELHNQCRSPRFSSGSWLMGRDRWSAWSEGELVGRVSATHHLPGFSGGLRCADPPYKTAPTTDSAHEPASFDFIAIPGASGRCSGEHSGERDIRVVTERGAQRLVIKDHRRFWVDRPAGPEQGAPKTMTTRENGRGRRRMSKKLPVRPFKTPNRRPLLSVFPTNVRGLPGATSRNARVIGVPRVAFSPGASALAIRSSEGETRGTRRPRFLAGDGTSRLPQKPIGDCRVSNVSRSVQG